MFNHIANLITLSRLIGSIILITIPVFTNPFMIVYTYCGISDAVDGFVARKLKIASELGKKLDSVADLAFYGILLYKTWPTLLSVLPRYVIVVIWVIFGIRTACYFFVMVRDKKLASEHLILYKATGLLMFFIPYLINTKIFVYYAILICIVAIVAALYEFYFHLTKTE